MAAFDVTGCRDYARVDLRVADDGGIYILEINGNPDIGPSAGFAQNAARRHGFRQFVDRLVGEPGRLKKELEGFTAEDAEEHAKDEDEEVVMGVSSEARTASVPSDVRAPAQRRSQRQRRGILRHAFEQRGDRVPRSTRP